MILLIISQAVSFSYDQQRVSDTALCSFITSYPIINRMSVTLPFFIARHLVSSHDQQYVSDTTLCPAMQSHHILSHEQQRVSDTALFLDAVMADLIWINSMWVILPLFLLGTSHLMTNRMCVTPLFFSVKQSHHSSFHDKQAVSDTIIFCLPASVITSHSIWTNREWVVSPFISSR